MVKVRMVRGYSGRLGDVWNPPVGSVIETTAANAELLIKHGVASSDLDKATSAEPVVETRDTPPAKKAPAAKPAKKQVKRRRRTAD